MIKKMHRDAIIALLRSSTCDAASMLEVTGWSRGLLDVVLQDMKTRVMAVPLISIGPKRSVWALADNVIAQCPWSSEQVLEAVQKHEPATRTLVRMVGCGEQVMRIVLLRMRREGKIKVLFKKGLRCWVLGSRPKQRPSKWPLVTDEQILAAIAAQQPVKLIQLAEQFGRGECFLARRIGVMRSAGLVRHDVMGDSWRFTLADYKNPQEHMRQKIALRCRDVGGDCLAWDGAHNRQGWPVVKNAGNTWRVDLVLWTVVHGLMIKKGHTLTTVCETKGCCNHQHHKQITISQAMVKAFAGHSPVQRTARNARLRVASSRRRNLLTPERLRRVREGTDSVDVLSREFGCSRQVILSARGGKTYREQPGAAGPQRLRAAHPFDGLLGRAA